MLVSIIEVVQDILENGEEYELRNKKTELTKCAKKAFKKITRWIISTYVDKVKKCALICNKLYVYVFDKLLEKALEINLHYSFKFEQKKGFMVQK